MRALVTGAGGFVGQWLCSELLRDGWDVHGAGRTGAPAGGTLKDWQRDAVFWHDTDVREKADVEEVVDATRPDAVFHLAGVSFQPAANADPTLAWSTNVGGVTALLDVIASRRAAGVIDPVVVIAGSGEQYGPHAASDLPLTEDAELRPVSVYAQTKVAQETTALAHARATGTRVVAARAFNHSGPGQASSFLLPSLVHRAQEACAQKRDFIPVGNLAPVRDFLHVEDVARAYIYLAMRGEPGEVYNVCSGVGTSVADLAALIVEAVAESFRNAFLGDGDVPQLRLVPDPALVRPADVPALVGSREKLTRVTTWEPKHTLDMLIDDLVYGEAD